MLDSNVTRSILKIQKDLPYFFNDYFSKGYLPEIEKTINDNIKEYLKLYNFKSTDVKSHLETWENLYPNKLKRYWVKLAHFLKLESKIERRKLIHFLFPYKKKYKYELPVENLRQLLDEYHSFVEEYDKELVNMTIEPEISTYWCIDYPFQIIYTDICIAPGTKTEFIVIDFKIQKDSDT